MEEQVDIKIFKAKEVRDWLWHNRPLEGYSNRILSPDRANAILHNPYILDDDPIASAVFEDDKMVACTAAFPDLISGQKVWWFTTLWCHPDCRGKGYALIAVGCLAEEYGEGNYFDMWGAAETVEIFKFLGLKNTFVSEYIFEQKNIVKDTFKGKLLYHYENWKAANRLRRSGIKKKVTLTKYRLMYTSFIDDNTYSFIQDHREKDIWQREQPMLNWIMEYSYRHWAPLYGRDYWTGYFAGKSSRFWKSGVKIFVDGKLQGYYYISDSDRSLSIKYLYYNEKYEEQVFASIAEHIIKLKNNNFSTRDPRLAQYISGSKIFWNEREERISFSYPESFNIIKDAVSQGGDGDGFGG